MILISSNFHFTTVGMLEYSKDPISAVMNGIFQSGQDEG